jgi:molybdopterin molybdotransferase
MVRTLLLGLDEACGLTLDMITPLESREVDLLDGLQQGIAQDVVARVDSPSIDASMKDGFAVISEEVEGAGKHTPIDLRLIGSVAAGEDQAIEVSPGTTVRVLTGARIPPGATAVVAEEYTVVRRDRVTFLRDAQPGRNILPRGSDVRRGDVIAAQGSLLTPGLAGLIAAAGLHTVWAIRKPRVAIIATGDEVVTPGSPLREGQLYASNLITLASWCKKYGFAIRLQVVKDHPDQIHEALSRFNQTTDAVITSGGAWTGDHDLVAKILHRLGWKQVFHGIRMGPGKATGFGTLKDKPVFILSGGPPSNLMGFLQIALPGLMRLAGYKHPGLPRAAARLSNDLIGRGTTWTHLVYGLLENGEGLPRFHDQGQGSRLQSMALAQAVVAIPEGRKLMEAGEVVSAQMLM